MSMVAWGASADRVVTPEAVVLDFETAGVASRLLAALIDLAVQTLLLVALILVAATSSAFTGGGAVAAAVYLSIFLIVFGYPAALETWWRGRTLGKAALGLRVVTANGLPVRFRHAAIRSMMGLLDKWLAGGGIGLLAVLLTRRNQRLGDLVAGTIVLRERHSSRAPGPVAFHPPAGMDAYCATLDVSRLTQHDYVTVRSFLLRAHTLPPGPRASLARDLAAAIHGRLGVPVPPGLAPEVWLACVLAARQGRAGPAPAPTASVWDLASVPPTGQAGAGAGGPGSRAGDGSRAEAGGYTAPG